MHWRFLLLAGAYGMLMGAFLGALCAAARKKIPPGPDEENHVHH